MVMVSMGVRGCGEAREPLRGKHENMTNTIPPSRTKPGRGLKKSPEFPMAGPRGIFSGHCWYCRFRSGDYTFSVRNAARLEGSPKLAPNMAHFFRTDSTTTLEPVGEWPALALLFEQEAPWYIAVEPRDALGAHDPPPDAALCTMYINRPSSFSSEQTAVDRCALVED